MNVRLRIINNQLIPELPSLTNNLDDRLTTDVKLDVLTHQEVDINFSNLIKYLKTIVDKLVTHNKILEGLSPEKLDELSEAAEQIQSISAKLTRLETSINNTNDNLESFEAKTNESLNKKIENIKTINGVNILGIGNADININRTQFVNHLTDIGVNEIGSIAILECKTDIIFNNQYSGQNLFNDMYAYMQGTWKCIGVIENRKGLFIRVA